MQRLTYMNDLNLENVILTEPKVGEISKTGNSAGASVTYLRCAVNVKYPNGVVGPLLIPTEELFSFGVGENTSQETGQVTGHTMSLCLWSRDRTSGKYIPTKEQFEWSDMYLKLVEVLRNQLGEFHKPSKLPTKSFTKYKYAKDAKEAAKIKGFPDQSFRSLTLKLNNLY